MADDAHAKIRSQFGAAASDYATSEIHAKGDSLRLLLELARPRATWALLDVATGAGHTALTFAPHVASIIAADLTEAMLRTTASLSVAKRVNNVRVAVADAECLPFPRESFDAVTCRLAFHHFPGPDEALREFRRVLKTDGVLAFTDNTTVEEPEAAVHYNAFERLRDPSHHCVYSLPRLKGMLTRSGFRLGATHELSKELEFEEWADRQKVSRDDKDKLITMLRNLPDALTPSLSPRWADGTLYFTLHEAVLLAFPSR